MLLLIINHVCLLVDVVLLHFLKLVGICSANKVALHVVDVAVRVHKVLLVFALNLDPAHHNVILNVYAFLLFLISCTLLLIVSIGQVSLVCGTHLVVDLLLIKCRIVINLLLLVLVLLLHLVTGRSSYADAQVVVVVVALSLIILHLKQVIILLL